MTLFLIFLAMKKLSTQKLKKYKVNSNLIKVNNSNKVVSDEEAPLTQQLKIQKIQVCGIVFNIN